MSINQAQFEKLVKELDKFVHQQPHKYKLRVKLLASLGYAYIIGLITFLLGLAGSLIYLGIFFRLPISYIFINVLVNFFLIYLAITAIWFTVIIFKSLKIYFPKPKGVELNRQQTPQLFQFIDDLTSTLQASKCDRILLSGDFNAGVVQIPRFWKLHENYLILGLPLMCALSLEQFRAVLAHELGHLSRNHSQLQGQVYLVRKTWYQVWVNLKESSLDSTFLLNAFLNWYAPFLYAYSFAMARSDEYEADRYAKEIAGADIIAEALIRIEVSSRYMQTAFWDSLYKQYHHQSLTPSNVYTNLVDFLSKDLPSEQQVKLLDLALDQCTSYADTHPCLSERLASIGYNSANDQLMVPNVPATNAAKVLLNDSLESYISCFNKEWQLQTSIKWYEWHKDSQDLQMRIEYLENQAKSQPLKIDKAWELASLTLNFKGDTAAIPKFKAFLDVDPKHADANYAIANILLEKGDDQGVQYMEMAMEQDYGKVVSGCELVRAFMRQKGDFERADYYRERGNSHYQLLLLAQEERTCIDAKDKFITHNLPKDLLESLSKQLSDYPQMKEAYIVQKTVKYFSEQPFYILGFVRRRILNDDYAEERDRELLQDLHTNLEFSHDIYIMHLTLYKWNLKRALSRVPKSKIPLY